MASSPPCTPAERHAAALAELDRLITLEDNATRAPWWQEDTSDAWMLFGGDPSAHGLQLIKAPKHGTPYAEYWPTPQDAALIIALRTGARASLAGRRRILMRHSPEPQALDGAIYGCRGCWRAFPCLDWLDAAGEREGGGQGDG